MERWTYIRRGISKRITGWPASWSSSQRFWLLIMRSRVRFPALPWRFFPIGENPHGDHGLGSQYNLGLRPHIRPVTRYRRSPRWRGLITFGSIKVRLCQHISLWNALYCDCWFDTKKYWLWVSSVSTVTRNRLDDQEIQVLRGKSFPSASTQDTPISYAYRAKQFIHFLIPSTLTMRGA
jgi:hypothetical protein